VKIKKISKNYCSFEDYISELSEQTLVQSEGVINTYESFSDASNYFIVMEAGTTSVMDIIFHGRLSEKTLKLLIHPVFHGLMKLHKNGVIHHDIKPENLVLCKTTGKLKIIDFGLAEICEGDDACKLRAFEERKLFF
jgi:serine/threonine protein kinase